MVESTAAKGAPTESFANDSAKHSMMIQYWGGWGYKSHVTAAIAQIDAELPDEFNYFIYRDQGRTGRLEFTVYKGVTSLDSDAIEGGVVVHSKENTGKYVKDNYQGFLEAVKASLQWANRLYERVKD